MMIRHQLAAIAAALLLVACGGGDPIPVKTTAVKVAGDSLNDSGTFGIKFTVQSSPAQLIWTDHVAAAVNAPALCPRYAANLTLNATSCTSYGVGGGRVNPQGTLNDSTPLSVVQQLKDIATAGNYSAEELLLVDGGGNDAADLVGAYLAAGAGAPAALNALLPELLAPADIDPTNLAATGARYMTALANLLADAVTTQALDKSAQRVVVITAPDVTQTPRFIAVLANVALANGGGTAGAAAAAAVKALANSWVVAFNNQLKSRFSGNSRVAVVDFYAELNSWISNPTLVGLSNTTTPACPSVGVDSQNVPIYDIATCTTTSLSAAPPVGVTDPNWWQTYVFSDNFHGTPRTNQLMGELVTRALRTKGWM